MSKSPFNFISGAVAGLALGVAAALFLQSKTGKKLTKEMQETLADFYQTISPKIKKIGEMTETEYKAFIKREAESYAKIKKFSKEMAQELMEAAQDSWSNLTGGNQEPEGV